MLELHFQGRLCAVLDAAAGDPDPTPGAAAGSRRLVIGRKTDGVDSKRCSREQVELRFVAGADRVTLTQLGTNSSYVVRDDGVQTQMTKNHPYTIRAGHSFFLLLDEFKFTLRKRPGAAALPPSSAASDDDDRVADAPLPARPAASSSGPVRAAPVSVASTAKATAAPPEPAARRQAPAAAVPAPPPPATAPPAASSGSNGKKKTVGGKEVCRFGVKCYRVNPDHFAEYAHPWKDAAAEESGSSAGGSAAGAPAAAAAAVGGNGTSGASRPNGGKKAAWDDEEEVEPDIEHDYVAERPRPAAAIPEVRALERKVVKLPAPAEPAAAAPPPPAKLVKAGTSLLFDEDDDVGSAVGVPNNSGIGSSRRTAATASSASSETSAASTARAFYAGNGEGMDVDDTTGDGDDVRREKPARRSFWEMRGLEEDDGEDDDAYAAAHAAELEYASAAAYAEPPPAKRRSPGLSTALDGFDDDDDDDGEHDGYEMVNRDSAAAAAAAASAGGPRSGSSTPKAGMVRLAFPSIATREGMVPLQSAAACLGKAVQEFFSSVVGEESIRVVLADSDPAVIEVFESEPLLAREPRFLAVKCENIVKIKQVHGIDCPYIACETNWRRKPESTASCRQVYEAGGSELADRLAAEYAGTTAKMGEAFGLEVSASSPLFAAGIRHVIHVVGPNMNPKRPDPIKDESRAVDVLGVGYRAMFRLFAQRAKIPLAATAAAAASASSAGSAAARGGGGGKPVTNAFKMMMSTRRKDPAGAAVGPGGGGPAGGGGPSTPDTALRGFGPGAGGGSWDSVLLRYVERPQSFPSNVVKKFTARTVVVYDAFPKAQRHFLVLPRAKIDNLTELQPDHLDILDEMKSEADAIAREFGDTHKFRMGFHSVPSMKHLHMHVISDDMVSPALKNKKHWNSFTTPFFVAFDDVRRAVAGGRRILINVREKEELLKGPLQCHKCREEMKNMPELKAHLLGHLS
ncbi:hypothetical protein DFJ73DRAFT_800944 [Zopfochytrium polystomum]|nr:hypothetical protein DFJ73DRAFT_800944 [Zopfochytrium polystomum]